MQVITFGKINPTNAQVYIENGYECISTASKQAEVMVKEVESMQCSESQASIESRPAPESTSKDETQSPEKITVHQVASLILDRINIPENSKKYLKIGASGFLAELCKKKRKAGEIRVNLFAKINLAEVDCGYIIITPGGLSTRLKRFEPTIELFYQDLINLEFAKK